MLATENRVDSAGLVSSLVRSGVPFAMYRLPRKSEFHLLISYSDYIAVSKIDFEELPRGFAFAPFQNQSSPILFLQADFARAISFADSHVDISDLQLNIDLLPADKNFEIALAPPVDDSVMYQEKVADVIARIHKGEARKVVLSRKKELGKISGNNYYAAFQALSQSHQDAMVSLVHLPFKKQVWLGASPEILVTHTEAGQFTTMSLAGTQSAMDKEGREIRPVDALWTHKEIEEQAMVGRYIINCLKKIRVREFEEEGPKTIRAGNVLHLRTFYSIDTNEVNFPNLSSVMLDLLHPTPAICGMPKEAAEQILCEVEGYDREYYSGYLGPVNIGGESHLYVNLRTLKIDHGIAYVYAGGGITEDSQSDKEWAETEMKMGTVLRAFDKF